MKKVDKNLSLFACFLALCVIILGAYTRLTDAGLGCPDWPGCYGHMLVKEPQTLQGSSASSATNGFHATKAWTEMIHRYMAGLLGIVIFVLGIRAILNRYHRNIQGNYGNRYHQPLILPLAICGLVVFQALLGMWTVTLKLLPLVVMAHLLGGFTTISLVWWLYLKLNSLKSSPEENSVKTLEKRSETKADTRSETGSETKTETKSAFKTLNYLRIGAILGLVVLIVQLFLGGWTSANYAALVCLDFPACIQYDWQFNFSKAFNLINAGVVGSTGEILDAPARMTIHTMHRVGALFTTMILGYLSIWILTCKVFKSVVLRQIAAIMLLLLIVQILLGITNVLALLPLWIAVAHNAVAVLLLLSLVSFNYYLYHENGK